MEVDALARDYTILAAGMSYNSNESRYSFFQLNTSSIKKKEIGFHLKYPALIRKTISLALRLIYFRSLNVARFDFRKDFKHLKKQDFQLIIVHHFLDLPLAVKLANHKNVKVIFNAHEYYPLEHDSCLKWMKEEQPTLMKIGLRNLPKIASCFCVGDEIAKKYKSEFGFESLTISNAKPYQTLKPKEINQSTMKLIHHGLALRNRKIELMIEVMSYLREEFVLHLILVPGDLEYINELKDKAEKYPNIIFKDIIETEQISVELNQYDIGVYILPPQNYNDKFALPNKFFEFIQARLAIAIAPSPEMATLVNKFDLGVVSADYTAKSLADEINSLSSEKIMYYKNQSHKYAKELSVEENWKKIHETVDQLIK